MRLGTDSPYEFARVLSQKSSAISEEFMARASGLAEMIETKVMLGDATITSQKTFDPKRIADYFQSIGSGLKGWSVQDVSTSSDEGLRRTFAKFEVAAGSYLLSGHVSVQFHVLLYYKPVQRVVECQKELAGIISSTEDGQQEISDRGDQVVLDRLREAGHKDFDYQKLFETFYENDEFREKVYAEIQKSSGKDFQKLSERKAELFAELDSLLLETYQTSPVLIDDARLVTGEEGFLCTFDLEFVKDGAKQGAFDLRKIPEHVKEEIMGRLEEFGRLARQ